MPEKKKILFHSIARKKFLRISVYYYLGLLDGKYTKKGITRIQKRNELLKRVWIYLEQFKRV